jgi:hypothetical protein
MIISRQSGHGPYRALIKPFNHFFFLPHLSILAGAGVLLINQPVDSAAADREIAIRFESASEPMYSIQSRFVGSAVVGTEAIEVRVESGVLSFSSRNKPGDQRLILGYSVGLIHPDAAGSRQISYSPIVTVGSNLPFGGKLILGATNLFIPLANITARTNHWLLFSVKVLHQVRNDEVITGTTHSQTATNLFTDLAVTGLTMPSMLTELSGGFVGFMVRSQKHFPVMGFVPPEQGHEAAFQRLKVSQNIVGTFDGAHYTGIQFTVPEWIDGDLEYAFVHWYRSQGELRRRPGYSWGVTSAATGQDPALNDVERVPFGGLPEMQARFPFTEKGYLGGIRRNQLVPGETYFLWWGHEWGKGRPEGVPPDLAVALTIKSERGLREYGAIVWR